VVIEYTCTTKSRGTHLKRVTYWLAKMATEGKVVLSHEHQAFKWLPLEEACKQAKYQEMIDTLKKCEAKLKEDELV